ncbi:hypothetical protein [Streptomyces sp. NPDC088726]|uniref:hypothetical protein n=1 Tax=Streptomyces sp. NPDC088726 TaxID=3365874 RepID=UPI00382BEAED
MTERLPSDVVEARLNHLIDRARRGNLLPAEADRFTTELRDLVRRLEDTEDERAHDNVALRAIARQRDEAGTQRDQAEDLLRVAHETSNRSEAERARAVTRAERAEAAIEGVRELATQWAVLRTYGGAAYELRAALDQAQQPTTTETS